jgi:hypothetical protein
MRQRHGDNLAANSNLPQPDQPWEALSDGPKPEGGDSGSRRIARHDGSRSRCAGPEVSHAAYVETPKHVIQ